MYLALTTACCDKAYKAAVQQLYICPASTNTVYHGACWENGGKKNKKRKRWRRNADSGRETRGMENVKRSGKRNDTKDDVHKLAGKKRLEVNSQYHLLLAERVFGFDLELLHILISDLWSFSGAPALVGCRVNKQTRTFFRTKKKQNLSCQFWMCGVIIIIT